MKKLLVAATALSGLLALTGVAKAADAVVMETVYDWTGGYVGLQGGYADVDIGIDDSAIDDLDADGWFGGLYAGWNYQWDSFVMGIEGDINLSDIDGEADFSCEGDCNVSGDIDWFGSVRGRLGFAMDQFLIFATGGVAFTEVDTELEFPGGDGSDDPNYTGWTLGGGIEFASWENTLVRLEYRYYDFGTEEIDIFGSDVDIDKEMHTVSLGVAWKF
jgi:outer membrane immunogenic protein